MSSAGACHASLNSHFPTSPSSFVGRAVQGRARHCGCGRGPQIRSRKKCEKTLTVVESRCGGSLYDPFLCVAWKSKQTIKESRNTSRPGEGYIYLRGESKPATNFYVWPNEQGCPQSQLGGAREGKVTSPGARVGHFLEAGARFSPSFERENCFAEKEGMGELVIVVQAQRTDSGQPHRLWNRT